MTDAFQANKKVDRLHAQRRMHGGVVVVFDPMGKLPVEFVDRGQIELAYQDLIADSAKEAFDFPLGGGVSDGCMTQDAAGAQLTSEKFKSVPQHVHRRVVLSGNLSVGCRSVATIIRPRSYDEWMAGASYREPAESSAGESIKILMSPS